MNKKEIQPKSVKRITCPKCGELMAKLYPWSPLQIQGQIPNCLKCLKKAP